jgi:hypothetical protein
LLKLTGSIPGPVTSQLTRTELAVIGDMLNWPAAVNVTWAANGAVADAGVMLTDWSWRSLPHPELKMMRRAAEMN